ncbi:MAG: sulfurtransferase [Deltaproteobacteria bacterium HGW-Deltaproteobacteria-3]|nr:MAG: sulfurtransferase [Deltaproteobacteria bacterium HGW-Deltaproteobacteria-3]
MLAHNREDVGPLLVSNQGVLADIRFPEEVATWRMGFGLAIPLNELPRRLAGLPKNKIIITACPHKDRSAIAMAYLRSKGYETKYLTNGLLGLAEQLRGERAKDFMAKLAKIKTGQKK